MDLLDRHDVLTSHFILRVAVGPTVSDRVQTLGHPRGGSGASSRPLPALSKGYVQCDQKFTRTRVLPMGTGTPIFTRVRVRVRVYPGNTRVCLVIYI